ncbi:MAG: efflux RND transporter periplasmic adaptor subunit [Proteobacteria bacterium]|nr:efflux RND transporter periplasmic adaptor subunit [Pseudomonadota bacterium]
MTSSGRKLIFTLVIIIIVSGIGWRVLSRITASQGPGGRGKDVLPVPVETAKIKTGPITLKRTFSGTLEAEAQFLVAPKVSGRVERLYVDISDTIHRGQIVCELDNGEYIQEVAQVKADLAVAKANLVEAENGLIIANRELDRVKTLSKRGVKSESQLDTAKTNQLEKEARLEVAKAQVIRAEAALETANIRLGYTNVTAEWSGEDQDRVVAERFVDEGDTVSATTSLISIVRLDPITGVIFITEKDYSRLTIGQLVYLSTDAFAEETFQGKISRIAPVFKKETRQARVEIAIANPEQKLKPGMFIRATIVLDHVAEAIVIPEQALTKRGDQTGVFMVNTENATVRWHPVISGIREDDLVEVKGIETDGDVVTLGQQLLNDGSKITLPEDRNRVDAPSENEGGRK